MKKIKPFSGWLKESAEVGRLLDLGLVEPDELVRDHFSRISAETGLPVEEWLDAELDVDDTSGDIGFIRARVKGQWPTGFIGSLSFAVYPDGGVLLMLDDLGQVPWRRLNTKEEVDGILNWGEYAPVKWNRVEAADWTGVWRDALKLWSDGQL